MERIGRPAVSVFGSARIHEDHPVYAQARDVGRRLADAGFAVAGARDGLGDGVKHRHIGAVSPTCRPYRV